LYLGTFPLGNAQVDPPDGGWAVATLIEITAAGGIGLFLGFVLRATFSAALISRSQERVLREAARARENAESSSDPYDRLPL